MFAELSTYFEQEVLDRRGTIVEDFRDTGDGYLSAMLPASFLIQPGDQLRAGLALMREQDHARLYVMTHRKVCINGVITTSLVKQKAIHTPENLKQTLPVAFTRIAPVQLREQGRQYQLLLDQDIDEDRMEYAMKRVRNILIKEQDLPISFFSRLPSEHDIPQNHFVSLFRRLIQIERHRPVHQGRRRESLTQFEVVNAITDLAHEIASPSLRWELMELGGELLHQWGKENRHAKWQAQKASLKGKQSEEKRQEHLVRMANA